jgi:hypothetical protein
MTDIQTLSPEDTGEIKRVGEQTINLAPVYLELPSARRPDVSGELPVIAWAPSDPPPPLPLPSPNGPPKPAAETERLTILGSLDYTTPSGPSTPPPVPRPLPPLRPAVPRKPALTRLAYKPKHRAPRVPSPLRGLAKFTVAVVAVTAALWWVIS